MMEKRARGKSADTAELERESERDAAVSGPAIDTDGLTPYTPEEDAPAAASASWAAAGAPPESELYARLATPFDVTFRDLRGGVELEYVRRITRR